MIDKKEIESLITSMPFSDEEKATLLNSLNAGTDISVVMVDISKLIDSKGKSLVESNPDAVKVYAEIQDDYNNEIKKADDEFNAKMDEIENEVESVNKEIGEKIDGIRVGELKATLEK